MKTQTKLKLPSWNSKWVAFIFPLVFIYYELIFKAFTGDAFFSEALLYVLLFSIAYGGICTFICSIFKNSTINRILMPICLALPAIFFGVEYFVYKQFKIFYDIPTIIGGAGGVASEFTDDVKILIFCFDGISKIILLLLPAVLSIVFGKKIFAGEGFGIKFKLLSIFVSAIVLGTTFVAISYSPSYSLILGEQYNFQSSVESFGLLTSIPLDVKNYLNGGTSSFEKPVDGTEPKPDPKPEIIYEKNIMDLDLESGKGRIAEINAYVKSIEATSQNEYTGIFKGKNLILITAEAFAAEVIDKNLTPTLYRLATKGINFTDYYQVSGAGTTGGEYQIIFGMMPNAGGMSFKNAAKNLNYFTMGSQLDRLGYYGKAYHNNSRTFYDRHKTHITIGYSDGFMAYGNGMEKFVKNTWPQSDLEMFEGTVPTYIDKQPFNVYYMTVSGHSGYSRSGNYMTSKNWHRVQHLSQYNETVKGYIAANLELEDALTYLVKTLEEKGIADDTVICLSTDHFPYGLDDSGQLRAMTNLINLYGQEIPNRLYRDHSALILWCGSLEKEKPIVVDTPVYSLDILPTLSNLFGTEFDSRLMVGRDVFSEADPLVFNAGFDWKTDKGTYIASTGVFTPAEGLAEEDISEEYIERIKAEVRNKNRYCTMVLNNDYFRYLFGDK
ncbi:MAG: sulfatase-like hydrolase/transferase [Ruminococcaceae bacterium]|nr:sulfatase-like hydrolase/transferase [Oscillospiraceae bacterium]